MSKYLSIGAAAEYLGVSTRTLRRWEQEKRLLPDERTKGGQRRYALTTVNPALTRAVQSSRETIGYARVSSQDQKEDLNRQIKMLEMYACANGWSINIISDLGSGMNYHKRGLKKLLTVLLDGEVNRLVLTHKDRLLRFGAELAFFNLRSKTN